jgi:hypothetical protein
VKRLLQALALLQVVLVIALIARIFSVLSTPLPQVAEIPDLPAEKPLPPARPPARVPPAMTEEIVDHDLFDESRGLNQDIVVDGAPLDETPVAPPSTVKLVGVMMLGPEPVGILFDTNVKPEQQTVRKGEMFGEYEVVDIHPRGLTLLGSGNQKYEIPLRIEAVAGGVAPPPPPPQRPGGAAAGAGGTPVGKAPATRPVTAKPASAAKNDAADGKVQTARERAQAIAQRNAEMRRNNPEGGGRNPQADAEPAGPDPVQARLEALRQLREAAKSR